MENIIRKTGDNLGGIRDLIFVPLINVDSIPSPINGEIEAENIAVQAGFKWNYFRFVRESAKFDVEEFWTASGITYRVKITGAVAKDNLNRFTAFSAMEYHEFLVLVRDYNDISHMIGLIDVDGKKQGMKFKTKSTTDKKHTGRNQVGFTFTLIARDTPKIAINLNLLDIASDPGSSGTGGGSPIDPPIE
jgi:hypothetical protein